MALDGIVIAGIVKELNDTILGGRINKIAQPEPDELLFTIKSDRRQQYRLLISAGASLPLIYFTETNKPGPLTAPNFCMLLRKHIGSGKFTRIWQPGLERIINFEIEHLNELGDVCHKILIVEIMGKHSNIIFCNDEGMIIDSIKHISGQVSSVREVLPGRDYFIPVTQRKLSPLAYEPKQFISEVSAKAMPLSKAVYSSFTGISPLIAEEVCHRASLESDRIANSFEENALIHLEHQFRLMMEAVTQGEFRPFIVYDEKEVPLDFSVVELTQYRDMRLAACDSVSAMLEQYYASKNAITRIRQRSFDLRRIVQTALDRNCKKYDLQMKQLNDTQKREKFRIYGELIQAYGYGLEEGSKKLTCLNYYDNTEVTIVLDESKTPQENAQHYFEKYNKLKRTYEATVKLTQETHSEIEHLESISTALDIAVSEEDLVQIKEELTQYGYIKRHYTGKKVKITSKPFHYISSDGFHMYVGKNNFQNEELTFKVATGNDWWFHAKDTPGSHVIVKTNGEELPDRTFEEAARLAAYYSKNRGTKKAEVDYIQKKHVKKVAGAKPGFVIYHTNYSMLIEADMKGIQEVK